MLEQAGDITAECVSGFFTPWQDESEEIPPDYEPYVLISLLVLFLLYFLALYVRERWRIRRENEDS